MTNQLGETFQRRFKVIADQVDSNMNKMMRKVCLVIDQALVLATPVDTGRARSNWTVGLDKAPREKLEPYAPGEQLGIGEGQNARAALDQAKEAIALYRNGQTIYISNNLEYIERLNEGWSAQAPAGFVEKSVQLGLDTIRTTRLTEGSDSGNTSGTD